MNLTIRYSSLKKSVLFFLLTIIIVNSNLAYADNNEDGYFSDTGSVIIIDGADDDWSDRLYGNTDNNQSDNNEVNDYYDPTIVVEV